VRLRAGIIILSKMQDSLSIEEKETLGGLDILHLVVDDLPCENSVLECKHQDGVNE
jgi:hypothetical protein